jgi:hypothetical protein
VEENQRDELYDSEASRALSSPEVEVEEVEALARPLAVVRGGQLFTGLGCTSGFSAIRNTDSTLGVVTAAHCGADGDAPDNNVTLAGHPAPWQDGRQDGSWDVQWHTVPAGQFDNSVQYEASGEIFQTTITGFLWSWETGEGDFVCKSGRSTDLTCGYINDDFVCPGWVDDCSDTFRQVSELLDGVMVDQGDSGGPVFVGNDAVGLVSGGAGSPGSVDLIYMPIGYISTFGLTVLTSDPPNPPSAAGQDDELLFYTSAGGFAYYNVANGGTLSSPINSSPPNYTSGWTTITNVDINDDNDDELLFYNSSNGSFRFYHVNGSGGLGSPVNSSPPAYSTGWTSIARVDLDADGDDELLFYNKNASSNNAKYYDVSSTGSLSSPISTWSYTQGWEIITAVDMDGDGDDELLFYKPTAYAYYDVSAGGAISSPIASGDYSTWNEISNVDLDADADDEMLFYRTSDNFYQFYDISPTGSLSLIQSGNWSTWNTITNVDIDAD